MAVVSFDIKDFEERGIDQKHLDEYITELGMEIEGFVDGKVEISITPNRPDLLDFNGLVRAINYLFKKRHPKEDQYLFTESIERRIIVDPVVKNTVPYILALVVKELDLSSNKLKYLINFTEKLTETYGRKRKKIAIGLHDNSKISGDIHYSASDSGFMVPLGDTQKHTFSQILLKHPKGVQYASLIKNDGKIISYLNDDKNIFALIPIVNSEVTRVTAQTKELFVDITGISMHELEYVANMLACSFIDAGAKVYRCQIDYAKSTVLSPILKDREIIVKLAKIGRTIGVKVNASDALTYVQKLGYYGSVYGNSIILKVPPFRFDVFNEQDIIEDIAIGYGYRNINPLPILSSTAGARHALSIYNDKLSSIMVGLGMCEVMNYYLTNEVAHFDKMNILKVDHNSIVKLAYSKTESLNMIRQSLIPLLLENLSQNAHERMPQRIFEAGSVFMVKHNDIIENFNLAFISEHSKSNFSEIMGLVDAFMQYMQIKYIIKDLIHPSFIEGRCAAIIVDGKQIGMLGELHPAVLSSFMLEEPACCCEITLIKELQY